MSVRRQLCLVLVLLAPAASPAQPQGAPAAKRAHDITLDDYFTLADIFHVALSPDGKHVAYTEGRWQQSTDDRKADLWVVSTDRGGKPRRLTADRANDRAPHWGADGRSVYFLGNRKREGEKRPPYDGKTQVWRVGLDGGEPAAVTRVEGGIEAFELDRRGRFLLYRTSEEKVHGDFRALREKFRHLDYGHGVTKFSQVWKLDLDTWRAEKLVDAGRVIREMALSPDGTKLAMITTPDEKVVSFEGRSRVDVHDAATGKITTLPDKVWRADAPSPYGWLEHLAWAGHGKALAFNVIFDAYPAEVVVTEWGDAGPASFLLPRPDGVHVKGYGSPLQWRGKESDLCFLGEAKGRVRLYCAGDLTKDRKPAFELLTPGDVVVESFHFNEAGNHPAAVVGDPRHFADLYLLLGSGPGLQRRLTEVNPQAAAWKLPRLSVVSWQGARGDRVEGILELPPDHQPGQRVPLVVEIHGGPTTASYYKLQYWIYGRTLLPAKGYAVLCPNYRGSTGYGDKFLTDLVGNENDLDVQDILKGVDALVEKGIADPERLAVTGWSNGGYLTNCILTHTTRFKAAVSGAGIVDAVMEFGSNDEPAYTIVFKRGFPWDSADRYHKASPTYALNKVRTPTLIHVGAKDERCPPGHSQMLYRALKEYVNVPTELIVYPDEGHGLMKYRNRRAKLEWDLAWLERYLLGKK